MRIYDTILTRSPVDKGWSGDKKECVSTSEGKKYLLRVTTPQRAERFSLGFLRMQQCANLQIPMCLPVELGQCPEGTYALHSWIEGLDAEDYIPTLPGKQQYDYGLDAGRILKKLHTLPAPEDIAPWVDRYAKKIEHKITLYADCPFKYENGDRFLRFIEENCGLLTNRPQTYQHGDYHIGNMMVDTKGGLTIIDFERDDYGDPWEEFNRIVWCVQAAPLFASGMVDGYFDEDVPPEFWNLLALYIACNTLSSLPWAVPFGKTEIQTMQNQAAQVLLWYQNMTNSVPTWYRRNGLSPL